MGRPMRERDPVTTGVDRALARARRARLPGVKVQADATNLVQSIIREARNPEELTPVRLELLAEVVTLAMAAGVSVDLIVEAIREICGQWG